MITLRSWCDLAVKITLACTLACAAFGTVAAVQEDPPAILPPSAQPPATMQALTAHLDSAQADAAPRLLLIMLRLPPPHFRPDASYGGRYLDDSGRGARHRIAEQLARQHGLTLLDDWPMPVLGVDCYVMQYSDKAATDDILRLLSHDPQVEGAQLVAQFHGMAADAQENAAGKKQGDGMHNAGAEPAEVTHSDPLYPVQPSARYWHVAELHKVTTGRDVHVAVIDSGIDDHHPDLDGQVAVAENFVDNRATPPEAHGTAVAGIIAARAGNGGILGVAPQARLMALRACWQQPDLATRCNSFTLGKALNYAIVHGASVINLSLSGPPDRLLDRLLDAALERGISVVGAIDPHATGPAFPASHRGVLAVASQVPPGRASTAMPDGALLAPGTDIPTTAPGARWTLVNGSSYAAAHVAGMAALLKQLQPGLPPAQLQRLMLNNATLNAGTIDACATIASLTRACSCSCAAVAASRRVSP